MKTLKRNIATAALTLSLATAGGQAFAQDSSKPIDEILKLNGKLGKIYCLDIELETLD